MKQTFDGETGYQEQQGRKIPMDDATVSARKAEKGLFPELFMEASNIELESMTTIDGTDVYRVKVTQGDKTSYRYYNVETNMLMRTEETTEAAGQSVTSITDYSNYKEVDGVMMPYSWKIANGPQVIMLDVTEIKVNEGVTEEDFN